DSHRHHGPVLVDCVMGAQRLRFRRDPDRGPDGADRSRSQNRHSVPARPAGLTDQLMRSSVLLASRARVRARVLSLGAGAVLAVGVAGCAASGGSSVKITGSTLTIYASAPPGAASDPVVHDVLDAERL